MQSQHAISTALRVLHNHPATPNPSITHPTFACLCWTQQKLLAWTRAVGSEVGGLWFSDNGALSWRERTAALSSECFHLAGDSDCSEGPKTFRTIPQPYKTWENAHEAQVWTVQF